MTHKYNKKHMNWVTYCSLWFQTSLTPSIRTSNYSISMTWKRYKLIESTYIPNCLHYIYIWYIIYLSLSLIYTQYHFHKNHFSHIICLLFLFPLLTFLIIFFHVFRSLQVCKCQSTTVSVCIHSKLVQASQFHPSEPS